jgi:hypothetical protein
VNVGLEQEEEGRGRFGGEETWLIVRPGARTGRGAQLLSQACL